MKYLFLKFIQLFKRKKHIFLNYKINMDTKCSYCGSTGNWMSFINKTKVICASCISHTRTIHKDQIDSVKKGIERLSKIRKRDYTIRDLINRYDFKKGKFND